MSPIDVSVQTGVRVTTKVAEKQIAAFRKEIGDEIFRCFLMLGRRARTVAKAKAPKASGELANSVKVIQRRKILFVGVGSPLRYAPSVELGTGQFYTGSSKQRANAGWRVKPPPVNRGLADWARSKGLEPYSVRAGLVQRQGTKAQPFLNPAVESQRATAVVCVRGDAIPRAARKAGLSTRAVAS